MAADASPHAHGRSEVWARPGLEAAILKERRLLGARLRALRVERHLTQEAAAESIGVHAKHLVRVELGQANVTIASLVAIATAYGVPLRTLFEKAQPAKAEEPASPAKSKPAPARRKSAPAR